MTFSNNSNTEQYHSSLIVAVALLKTSSQHEILFKRISHRESILISGNAKSLRKDEELNCYALLILQRPNNHALSV